VLFLVCTPFTDPMANVVTITVVICMHLIILIHCIGALD
jgi:hypothetical protein